MILIKYGVYFDLSKKIMRKKYKIYINLKEELEVSGGFCR